jgi:hypothetical protein
MPMEWQVHYRTGGQQFRVTAADRSAAIAIACILIGDGCELVALVSTPGETIERTEIERLCGR